MLVIAKHAEEHFLRLLENPDHPQLATRCFQLKLSKLETPRSFMFQRFLNEFQAIPNVHRARVYFCEDGDVFILMRGLLLRQFKQFIASLANQLHCQHLEKLSAVYELAHHHPALLDVAYRKYFAVRHTSQAEHISGGRRHTETVEQAIASLPQSLLQDLPHRRAQRHEPLVMIADDDMTTRTLVRHTLAKRYHHAASINGCETIIRYVQTAPDVLFLDIGLPDISGHKVLEILFEIDPNAYVIMFSAQHDSENVLKALKAGAQGFVCKPFTGSTLRDYIDRSPFVLAKRGVTSTMQAVT